MKRNKSINCVLGGLAMASILAGCASSSGYKQADKTGGGIADFRNEVVNLKQAVSETMTQLDRTAEAAATDPRKPYQEFAKSIDKLESARVKADKRAESMKAAGAAYFKQWEEQLASIENPDIRKLAEERKAKLSEIFGKLQPLLEQTKANLDPFLSDLRDLRSFLNQDLTIAGVDAAKGIIKTTRKHGTSLETSLDELIAEMNSIAAALTPAKVPEKPKA